MLVAFCHVFVLSPLLNIFKSIGILSYTVAINSTNKMCYPQEENSLLLQYELLAITCGNREVYIGVVECKIMGK